jgi:DNA-binding NarL/FixJ family response regulator
VKRPRILLADDHGLVAEALQTMLAATFEIVGVVGDGRALVKSARQLKPDAIVVDISMPLLNGLDAGQMVHVESPAIKLVFVTMNQDPDLAVKAFRCGASGYLLKNSAGSELVTCLQAVLEGRRYLTRLLAGGDVDRLLLNAVDVHPSTELSPREKEVLQLIAEGKSMKEVAVLLGITHRTVQFHKYGIMVRFHLKSNAELVQFAVKRNLIQL